MKDKYLQDVISRSNELALLDRAARLLPERSTAGRWIVAAALGLLTVLYPAFGAAQVFSYLL